MRFEEFVRRLWQYWVVMCATRRDVTPPKVKENEEEQVSKAIVGIWKHGPGIARGDFSALRYFDDHRALQIRRHGFEDVLDEKLDPDKHPFRVFYSGRQFASAVRRFADERACKSWRKKITPPLDKVQDLIAFGRESSKGELEAMRDLTFVGTLVQQPISDATTVIGFKDLSPDEAKEYATLGKHAMFVLPGQPAPKRALKPVELEDRLPRDPDAALLLRILAVLDLLELPTSHATVTAVFEHLCGSDPLSGTRLEDALDKLTEQALVTATRSRLAAELPIISAAGRVLVRGRFSLPKVTGRFDDIAAAIVAQRQVFDDPDDILLRLTIFYEEGRRYDRALAIASRGESLPLRQHAAVLLVHAGRYDEALAALDALADDAVFVDEFVATFSTLTSNAALVAHARAAEPKVRRMLQTSFKRLGWQEELLAL